MNRLQGTPRQRAVPGPAAISIRPVRDHERAEIARVVVASWGSVNVASRGELHFVTDLPCLLAADGERWLGVAAYRPDGGECELVLLEAFERGRGVGTALLEATSREAIAAGCGRLWLVTTNDNLAAQRFYLRRGLRLVRVWADAVTESRKNLKPEIPLIGENGVPIRDELEFELSLENP